MEGGDSGVRPDRDPAIGIYPLEEISRHGALEVGTADHYGHWAADSRKEERRLACRVAAASYRDRICRACADLQVRRCVVDALVLKVPQPSSVEPAVARASGCDHRPAHHLGSVWQRDDEVAVTLAQGSDGCWAGE